METRQALAVGKARVTLAEATTEQIRRMILAGELPDGAPLRQDGLADLLGVSRIPVREALARLELEGLATSFPHRGYVVTALSGGEIEELFDLRATLEPDLLKAAIPRMTSEELDSAAAELATYNAVIDRADVASWGEHNRRFHMALYAPSGRRRTLEIVRGLLINTDRYTRLVLTLGAGVGRAKEDHGGLLELCRIGAVKKAVALTRDHIERARADLRHMLEKDASRG